MNKISHKLEFQNKKVKIYDDNGNLIGIGEQTKGNLFYLDPIVDTCWFAKLKMFGCGTKGYVMLIWII